MTTEETTMFGRRIGYNERKRRRKRARMRRMRIANAVRWYKRKGWVLTLLLVVATVALWQSRFYLHQINPLELRHLQYIEIEGNRMLSWEDVVQSAQVETGMLMSELDADSVKKSLLQISSRLRFTSSFRKRPRFCRCLMAARVRSILNVDCRSRCR